MLKNISNLGTPLTRAEQQSIQGGRVCSVTSEINFTSPITGTHYTQQGWECTDGYTYTVTHITPVH